MFEGLVRQLLLGYLGRYVKDIHKDQLKITVWNEEVLLENVELILEAFDYLQLPFALKQGRVGKLSIKIPWKKLGREPIIIILEDIFICASQRDEQEWRSDAVERRDFAGKQAKLAAAELAKLSRRMCDDRTGNPFISYIAAKILDSIQVSMRNFHVLYSDTRPDSAQVMFGLRFSSLTITRQSLVGSSSGKGRGGQVNKIVEIEDLEIYCSTYEADADLMGLGSSLYSNFWCNSSSEGNKFDHLLKPFNVSVALLVNRSGKLYKDLPQYSISAELTGLIMSLSEVQLQQILILLDYLHISRLREKYGRYRPTYTSLSRKSDGWQKLWWRYALESVLADVRKKLKKTSWKYLGQRLNNRRKYVNLYKIKLDFLRQDQPIDETILRELEKMEKECDIDDILSYRSVAECELQEVLSYSSNADLVTNGANISVEKPQTDEHSVGRSRGWLNWLSRGMLGAGGTDDSTQFSGVVSDEVVKDIYEATEFHPLALSTGDPDTNDKIYTCAIKISIHKISATLWSVYSCQEIAKLDLLGGVIECKLWEELATIILFVNSGKMTCPHNGKDILQMRESCTDRTTFENEPSCRVQVDMSSPNQDVGLSVKVMLQTLEVAFDADFFLDFVEFFAVIKSFKFQHERVLSSLNGLEDVKTRLLAKAEYILSNHNKVKWDVSVTNVSISFPWQNAVSEQFNMVLKLGSVLFISKSDVDCVGSAIEEQAYMMKNILSSAPNCDLICLQFKNLYDCFEVKLSNFEIKLMMLHHSQTVSVLEKSCASVTFAFCIIPDESIMKQLEVNVIVSSLYARLSPSIYESIVGVIALLDIQHSRSYNVTSNQSMTSLFHFNIHSDLESVTLHVDLANDGENSSVVILSLQDIDIRYSLTNFEECWISMKALEMVTFPLRGEKERHILFSSGTSTSARQQGISSGFSNQNDDIRDRTISPEACFLLHYKASRSFDLDCPNYTVCLSDADLHCFPYIFGLLAGFYDRISSYDTSFAGKNYFSPSKDAKSTKPVPHFGFRRFGFSNFFETVSSEDDCISLDHYPFVTIDNSGSLGSLESSLLRPIPDWRKLFSLRDKKFRSSCSLTKESENFHASSSKSTSVLNAFPVPWSYGDTNSFVVNINLYGIRVHFHDSSCIFGTITLPTTKSSVVIVDNCLDVVCSAEGLILTSSWWTKYVHDFLWGPSSPNFSPILNVRVRTGNFKTFNSELEVSIGIQHVCCILLPEYLAVVIGYFSLPEWNSNSTVQPVSENGEYIGTQTGTAFTYKFEILDSTVILPVEGDHFQYLKIDIQQLYCSYSHECALSNVLWDIPTEYVVPPDKAAKRNNCFNIFGRDLSLSLLLAECDQYGGLVFDGNTGYGNTILVEPLSVDVWVRIPCESDTSSASTATCIMSRIEICQLIVDDCYGSLGFQALLDVINQFSLVQHESKSFTSDVFQFIQARSLRKENSVVSSVYSDMIFTEVRCCVDSLRIKLDRLKDSVSLEPVAEAEMKFVCSASLTNGTPISLEFSFSSFVLYSVFNSIMLGQCTNTCSGSSVLDISLLKTDHGGNELHISVPSLNIWLYFIDWIQVIDFFDSYAQKGAKPGPLDVSSKGSAINIGDPIGNVVDNVFSNSSLSTPQVPENAKQDTDFFTVKSENIGIIIHFPFWANEEGFGKCVIAEVQEQRSQNVPSSITKGKHCKFIEIAAHSRNTELFIIGRNAKLKSVMEKISCTVGGVEAESLSPLSLFQISQVDIGTEICGNHMERVHVDLGVHCDQLDLWLSHQVLSFWCGNRFDIPEAGSSQFAFGSLELEIQFRKIGLLISDGRWSCSGPLLEVLLKNFLLKANATKISMESSIACDFEVNYNNIHKVFWEPFVEPWKFDIKMIRQREINALLNSSIITNLHLTSAAQLNLNFTESLIECVFRTIEMVKDAWGLIAPDDISENQRTLSPQFTENICGGKYAPYILQNLTSLPLVYHVYQGLIDADVLDVSTMMDGQSVQPGDSVPIFLPETPEKQLCPDRHAYSSDRFSKKQSTGVVHHLMTFQLDGTSVSSAPVSMDLVGITYFEVDFSKASNYNMNTEENGRADTGGFIIPVLFDVSVQRHSKLIRLYSTVIILNTTSIPLELRFDIPFGVSPKILDPVYPGQELPLPLHLAKAGRMRLRPLGNLYLWSEAHGISDVLSQESKMGFLRSFVCYPSHPSSEPFRCCISVQNISLPTSGQQKVGSSFHVNDLSDGKCSQLLNSDQSKKQVIHQVTLSTPLIVHNYLPEPVSLTIESGGSTCTTLLYEVETSFHHIDPSHDLGLEFNLHGFRPSCLKFPRTETFSGLAKFSGTKFSQSENLCFGADICSGPLHVTIEKMMDILSGARELFIFVPFLLYNCTGFPLIISDCINETKGTGSTIPSCYDLIEQEVVQVQKDGLSLLSSNLDSSCGVPTIGAVKSSFSNNHVISTRGNINPYLGRSIGKPLDSSVSCKHFRKQSDTNHLVSQQDSLSSPKNNLCSSCSRDAGFLDNEHGKVKACIYSPHPTSTTTEIMVRVSMSFHGSVTENIPKSFWSEAFPLVPPSGSTIVLVPQPSSGAAFMISVTSSALAGAFAGRTQAITFQPRYVISNASSKDICYKQKGTDFVFQLGIGQHSHLHWTDTSRELLVSIRFNEPGWQWSGSFLPDHLGDTQVKMRNYVSGALNMIRVEVQNADVSIRDERIVGSLHGNSGTNLILLSDDDTGYVPYRIDNFSKERLRIYQQRCETFDTIVHPYTSSPYAWDEPCYPHRLIVEVPGERVLGSYALDDLKEYVPVYLQPTSEKPERRLFLSVYAQGATKVLSIIDSSYHDVKDMKDQTAPQFQEKGKQAQEQNKLIRYTEKFSVIIPYIGISLINSYPQELLFACAKNITVELLQSLDQQKLSFEMSSLQIDNQLRTTPYPVVLSFNHENRSNLASLRTKDGSGVKHKSQSAWQVISDSCKPVLFLSLAKWRKKDVSLVSFEYISLRVADFCLELEQELILSLLDFVKTFSFISQSRVLPFSDPTFHPLVYDVSAAKEPSVHDQTWEHVRAREDQLHGKNAPLLNKSKRSSSSLPEIVPIGAPWQQIYLLARRHRKIYIELFDLAPVTCSLSFSSAPWMLRNGILSSGESLIHRGLMALADVEGAQIHLKELSIAHHMASWESFQEILIRHYTRQLFHEMYKVFGSAGVIGNPMGFARSLGFGIRDFLSVPARSVLKSPTGLITGMAQGTTSLVSNTVYALSDAATQFSKAAHKGIVAFTFDDHAVARMEKRQKSVGSHSKGVINEVFEGLTGLLQSPIKEAEKHGLPGILSGIALGVTGLVARPAASILEVTGKTAQSIRNRSRLHHAGSQRYRVRLPRPLSKELPLKPYSWEEAVGISVLVEADDSLKLKDEVLVMCKPLKESGKFVVITEKLLLVVSCSSLVDFGRPEFRGIAVNPEWLIETEISLESIIHADSGDGVVHIVGSISDAISRQNQHHAKKGGTRTARWNSHSTLPLFQTNLDLASNEYAEHLLQVLLLMIKLGKGQGWGVGHLLHQSNIK